MGRKEWLEKRIDVLAESSLFADLSWEERQELVQCEKEYGAILLKEHQAKEAERQEKSKEMKRRRARGKYTERKVAKDVGGRVDGRAGKKDVVKGMFYFETKSHKKTPKYLRKIMDEAIRHCTRDKIPVGVIYDRERNEYYYIMMREPWISLHGKGIK